MNIVSSITTTAGRLVVDIAVGFVESTSVALAINCFALSSHISFDSTSRGRAMISLMAVNIFANQTDPFFLVDNMNVEFIIVYRDQRWLWSNRESPSSMF